MTSKERVSRDLAQQIRGVAVRLLPSGLVITMDPPARHHNIVQPLAELMGRPLKWGEHIQGFLSATGKFMTREDAARLCGRKGQLYSEDLW